MGSFDLIAFDGDDTLWHNERHFRDGRDRFRALLAEAGYLIDETTMDTVVNQIEVRNLEHFGYGISNFALSLIEAAAILTQGQVPARDVLEIIELARTMITSEIELFPGVKPTLVSLSRRYPLMLITKGDLLHQRSKLSRSGLERYFRYVEVVSHKTPDVYEAILERHDVPASRFLMIGNSLRSDVLPVVKIGARAVHIPAALTWSHEHAVPTAAARRRFFERTSMAGLPRFVEGLERSTGSTAASRSRRRTMKQASRR